MSSSISVEQKYAVRNQLRKGLEANLQRELTYPEQHDLTAFVKRFDDETLLLLIEYLTNSTNFLLSIYNQVLELAPTNEDPIPSTENIQIFAQVPPQTPEVQQIISSFRQFYSIEIPWEKLSAQQRSRLQTTAEEYSDQLATIMELQSEYNKLIAQAMQSVVGQYNYTVNAD